MFNSPNNDNSMLWLLIILFMMQSNANSPFKVPSTEEINKVFQTGIGKFLEGNKEALDNAKVNDPIWQLNELYTASKAIDNSETNAKVLGVAMSIMSQIDPNHNGCCCGGEH